MPFELEPHVRGAFGYAPPARLRFDDPQPVAADALESRAPNAALEAGAVVDDLDPQLSVIGLRFHRYLSLSMEHGVVYKLGCE